MLQTTYLFPTNHMETLLKAKIADLLDDYVQNSDKERFKNHYIEVLLQVARTESFSSQILKNNNVEKTCRTCGQKTVYYKKNLRKSTVDALRCLQYHFPMTTKEVKERLFILNKPEVAHEMFKTYSFAKYFGLLEKTSNLWHLTEKGKQFLHGSIPCETYFYGAGKEAFNPMQFGLKQAPKDYIQDIVYCDESDATLHYEEALPMEQLPF